MKSGRRERAARNEALFRAVNERVRELSEPTVGVSEATAFVCECGREDCTEEIELTLAEYERLRAEPADFAVVPGHEILEVETIVERAEGDRYVVVRKLPAESAIARETDPRA